MGVLGGWLNFGHHLSLRQEVCAGFVALVMGQHNCEYVARALARSLARHRTRACDPVASEGRAQETQVLGEEGVRESGEPARTNSRISYAIVSKRIYCSLLFFLLFHF